MVNVYPFFLVIQDNGLFGYETFYSWSYGVCSYIVCDFGSK